MRNNSGDINWGIIGCGNVTEVKSGPAFSKVPGSRLYAVMRRDREKLIDYARRHSVPKYYESAEALIHDPEVDAVYIATPPGSHRQYALQVASANKHCCIEKPMALNASECREILDAFAGKSAQLFVAYYRRSLPRFNQVKAWLDAGKIGAVRHVSWGYSRPPSERALSGEYDWHTDPQISGGGHFVDLACHGLDLFIYLLGDISAAKGIATNQQGLYPAEDAVAACWIFDSGITGSGHWNFGAGASCDDVIITGSAGSIHFSVFGSGPFVLETAAGVERADISNPENIQYFHIENMIQHLRGNLRHPSLGQDGQKASWVMDQILSGYYPPTTAI
ncbi:Gfo/Idh/MocA family protein [Microbulbifer pacificus]|uniref:Gfo/Idh/MocA family oxidoreductase n=1 Tax=Microbulbifer pacificus TaxID=407164 RepID=A0AAU0MV21_9GAMM|nr:Gfo/Idh/MocA family oxidoreductase [Microbulbifer pacificus]WOX04019.1 Gfo/Idh/MocA family oxidoreductase [Microbulbifer pacificus]